MFLGYIRSALVLRRLFYILVAVQVTPSSRSNLGWARLFSILVGVLVGVLVTGSSPSNLGRARLFGIVVAVRVPLSSRGTLGPSESLGRGWRSIRIPQCRPS